MLPLEMADGPRNEFEVKHLAITGLMVAIVTTTACSNWERSGGTAGADQGVSSAGPPPAQGTVDGGGADLLPQSSGAAWFVDQSRTIKICYNLAPSFGVDRKRAESAILRGMNAWTTYAAQRVNEPNGHHNLSTKFVLNSSCSGSDDLVFYFGITPPKFNKLGVNQVAHAFREEFSTALRWGKGYIWFASDKSILIAEPENPLIHGKLVPDWSIPQSFEGIVLHEIGHLFGNSHVDGTIMRENIAELAFFRPKFDRGLFSEIDHELMLVNSNTQRNYKGRLGLKTDATDHYGEKIVEDNLAENFELLFGRQPVGVVHAELSLSSASDPIKCKSELAMGILIVEDNRGRKQFEICSLLGARLINPLEPRFKRIGRVSYSSGEFVQEAYAAGGGWSALGTLDKHNGETAHITIEGNQIQWMSWSRSHSSFFPFGGKIGMRILHESSAKPFFTMISD